MFIVVCATRLAIPMQNCPRQLAMQSCALCLYVRCGSSNKKKQQKKTFFKAELNIELNIAFSCFLLLLLYTNRKLVEGLNCLIVEHLRSP